MDIYEKREGGAVTLTIDGRLDATAAQVLERYFDRVKDGLNALTLDFSMIKYISSAGLRSVIIILKWMNGQKKRFAITNIPDEIRSVFATAGLIKLFVRDEKFIILQRELTDDHAVYALAGVLDSDGLPQVVDIIKKLEGRCVENVVFDCTKVPSISIGGKQILEEAVSRWKSRSWSFTLQNFTAVILQAPPPKH